MTLLFFFVAKFLGSGTFEQVKRTNENSQLEGLRICPPQDVEQIGAEKLNNESRQQDWGQEKDGFSGNLVRTWCLLGLEKACEDSST